MWSRINIMLIPLIQLWIANYQRFCFFFVGGRRFVEGGILAGLVAVWGNYALRTGRDNAGLVRLITRQAAAANRGEEQCGRTVLGMRSSQFFYRYSFSKIFSLNFHTVNL